MFDIICSAISAILLFFYAIHRFSKIVARCNIHQLKRFFAKIVNNPFKSISLGASSACLMQSNKAVSAIVLTLVNAGAITVLNAVPILFSTPIGSSSTAFLVSMKFKSMEEILIILGAIIKKTKYKNIGHIIFYLGLLLLALEIMTTATNALQNEQWFRNIFTITNNAIILFLIGIILSFTLQVSALFVGLTTILVNCGAMPMYNAISLSNGVIIGSTLSLLIVSWSMNDKSKKACYIHIVLMVIAAISLLPFTNIFAIIGNNIGNNGFGYAVANFILRTTMCIIGLLLFYLVYYNKYVKKLLHLGIHDVKNQQHTHITAKTHIPK